MLAMRPGIPSSKSCRIRSRDKKPEMLGMLVMRPPTPSLCRAGASKKPGLVKKEHLNPFLYQVLIMTHLPKADQRCPEAQR